MITEEAQGFLTTHLGLVPGLSLSPAPLSDLLILGFDFSGETTTKKWGPLRVDLLGNYAGVS